MKNPFKKKKIQDNISNDASSENTSPEDLSGNKKALREEKKLAKQAKKLENQKIKQEKKAEKKKARLEKKQNKPQNPPKPPKPKLTKEEKLKLKNAKQLAKAKSKADKARAKVAKKSEKIRARVTQKTEKLQLKKEQRNEKKQAEKQLKAEKKQLKKELRAEIKAARKGMPKDITPIILTLVLIVLLLACLLFFLGSRGAGPLAPLNPPNPVSFVKSILPDKLPGFLKSIKPASLDSVLSDGEKKAEAAVDDLFNCLISLDFEAAKNYIDINAVNIPDEYLEFIDTNTLRDATFDRLEYEIISIDKADDSEYPEYLLITNITAIDARLLMAPFIRGALQFVYDNALQEVPLGQAGIEQRIESMFLESAARRNLATITHKTTMRVRNVNGVWIVMPDDNFIDALFGGALSAAGNFFD